MRFVLADRPAATSRFPGLMRDLTTGLRQQMFYWGRDVVHPRGNLLLEQGFSRMPSAGLQGTSCYRCEWEGGTLELHGACADWYPRSGESGFIFIRPAGKCLLWLGADPPVPGEWNFGLSNGAQNSALYEAGRPFLRWWLASEAWIADNVEDGYRVSCFRHYKRLPKSKTWLAPDLAPQWLRELHDGPATVARARRFVSVSANC